MEFQSNIFPGYAQLIFQNIMQELVLIVNEYSTNLLFIVFYKCLIVTMTLTLDKLTNN